MQETAGYVAKVKELKKTLNESIEKETVDTVRDLRLMAVTVMIMSASTSGLIETDVRKKMQEAQLVLRKGRLTPASLTDPVKNIYSNGLAMLG